MQPSDSPFSKSRELRELPFAINGSFDWLEGTNTHDTHVGLEIAAELPAQLNSITSSAAECNVTLPNEFVTLIGNPNLHRQLRSVNDCYLEVAESLLPFAEGYLVRFLADSQGAAFWYLFLTKDGSDHAIVMSYEYFDKDEMDYDIDEFKESDFVFEAESFETYICRFWLENEILFAQYDETPAPKVDQKFLELYAQ